MSRKQAVLAGLLSVIYPGLGHVYLREWLRALGWFGLALATTSLVIPDSTLRAIESVEFGVLLEASRTLPRDAILAIVAVRALNVADAVLLGLERHTPAQESAPTCPDCGGDLDEDLDFCPWCTRRLGPEGE